MHDPEAVGEPRVLGGREDPARALELADPAQPLEPGGVEQVLLGDVLVGQPGGRRLGRGQALGQLDVPVDRVADQVDRGERLPAHRSVRAPRSASRRSTGRRCPPGRGRGPACRTSDRTARSVTVRAVARRAARDRPPAPLSTRASGPRTSSSPAVWVWSTDSAAAPRPGDVVTAAVAADHRGPGAGQVARLGEDERAEGTCAVARAVAPCRRRRSCSVGSSSAPSGRAGLPEPEELVGRGRSRASRV